MKLFGRGKKDKAARKDAPQKGAPASKSAPPAPASHKRDAAPAISNKDKSGGTPPPAPAAKKDSKPAPASNKGGAASAISKEGKSGGTPPQAPAAKKEPASNEGKRGEAISKEGKSGGTPPHAPAAAKAIARMIRISPQKLNLVARSIRGLAVERALNELTFSRRRISHSVKAVLESAIANAENNHSLNIDDLIVAEAHVGKALVMRRFRPRAKGRASPIMKPFSRLTIIVREGEPAPRRKRARQQKVARPERARQEKVARPDSARQQDAQKSA